MTPDEKKLLSLGEEDFFGLWEIAGMISPSGHETPLTAAKRTVNKLWAAGLIQLVWGEPNPQNSPLTSKEVVQILAHDSWWEGDRPFAERQVWLSTTDSGAAGLRGSAG